VDIKHIEKVGGISIDWNTSEEDILNFCNLEVGIDHLQVSMSSKISYLMLMINHLDFIIDLLVVEYLQVHLYFIFEEKLFHFFKGQLYHF
jgi:hypothetical protein